MNKISFFETQLYSIKKFSRLFITTALILATSSLTFGSTAIAHASYNSGIIVEPVNVPYCAPGTICTNLEFPFPYTYNVKAISGHRIVTEANPTGPGNYTFVLPKGTYNLQFSATGYIAQPLTGTISVTANQYVGPVKLHFMSPN